jgi:hypothetical protein
MMIGPGPKEEKTMAINFSVPEVIDCLGYLQHFLDTQTADQQKYNSIGVTLPNNWGSDEVQIFNHGIAEFTSAASKMQATLNDLNDSLNTAQQAVADTSGRAKTAVANAIAQQINH